MTTTTYQYTGPAFTYTSSQTPPYTAGPPGDGVDLTGTVTFNMDMSNANGWYGGGEVIDSSLPIVSPA
jgi:hypothetical protein